MSYRYALFLLSSLLLCTPQSHYAMDAVVVVPSWYQISIEPNLTKRNASIAFIATFVACSIRLFAKQRPKGELRTYSLSELLKIWNILKPAYWQAVDSSFIGTRAEKPKEVITTTLNVRERRLETRTVKEPAAEGTGVFGYGIYQCLLMPLKDIADLLKPVTECNNVAKLFYF